MADWDRYLENPSAAPPSTPEEGEKLWDKYIEKPVTVPRAPSKEPIPYWMQKWLGPEERRMYPSTIAKMMGKGVPVLRNYVPQDDRMTAMEEDRPITAGATKVIGGAAATLPLVAATGGLTGPALLPAMAGQVTLGAGLNAADTLAEKGGETTGEDLAWAGAKGAGFGATGPLASKILSPGTVVTPPKFRPPTKPNPEPPTYESIKANMRGGNESQQLNDLIAKRRAIMAQTAKDQAQTAKEAARAATRQKVASALDTVTDKDSLFRMGARGVMGAMPFAYFGAHPAVTTLAALGGAAAPHIPKVASAYAHNTKFQEPSVTALINALMQQQNAGNTNVPE